MKPLRIGCLALALLTFWSAAPVADREARAQGSTFDELATGATTLTSREALSSLLWSYLALCEGIDSDFARRQCVGLRQARQAQVTGKTFLIDAEAGSLIVAVYDEKKKSVEFSVHSCLACALPLSIEGQPQYVVGNTAAPSVSGGAVLAAPVHTSSLPFKTRQEADTWREKVLPRLHTQLLFRIPPGGNQRWTRGDVQGVAIEVVGVRIHDKCTGDIVSAKPEASQLPGDRSVCPAEMFAKKPDTRPKKPPAPVLPAQLTPVMIKTALRPASETAQKCFETYGVAGSSRALITISGAGDVTELSLSGDFEDTPTGTCIIEAVKAVKFPKTKKASTTVRYPFVLR